MRSPLVVCVALGALLALAAPGCTRRPRGAAPRGGSAEIAARDPALPLARSPAPERRARPRPPAPDRRLAPHRAELRDRADPRPGGARIGGAVILRKVSPKPGHRRTFEEVTQMSFGLPQGGRTVQFSSLIERKKTELLLAAQGSRLTRLRVTYQKVSKLDVSDGRSKTESEPTLGKTYVVEAVGGALRVTSTAGSPVPAPEQKLVRKDYRSLGKPSHVFDAIPTTPVSVGARVPALEKALERSFQDDLGRNPKETWTVRVPAVRLNGTGRVDGEEVAFFGLTMTMTMAMTNGAFRMAIHGKGSIALETRTGWPLRMTLTGTLDVLGTKGAGQITVRQRYQYH